MKLNLSNQQKKISLLILTILLLAIIFLVFFINKNDKNLSNPDESFKPVFLDSSEKTRLNISPEIKVQVLKRNAEGKIILYKVIKNDSDVITDLNQIKPVISNSN